MLWISWKNAEQNIVTSKEIMAVSILFLSIDIKFHLSHYSTTTVLRFGCLCVESNQQLECEEKNYALF